MITCVIGDHMHVLLIIDGDFWGLVRQGCQDFKVNCWNNVINNTQPFKIT